LQALLSVVLVSIAAFAVLFAGKKLGAGRSRGPISLVGQLALDPRRAIYLIEVGGQVLVVGSSEAGFTKLGEMTREALGSFSASEARTPLSFAHVLRRLALTGPLPQAGEEAPPPHE
jgi:flagellar biogenesis protein FliO